ncbi:aroA [Gossypium arboreum]|uniref:AroA n=1 Tax=Gossypium arboreum TaxID=29729 RepID=A0A0B0N6Z2_GOSAR|nr:aroA [Gossypium arboreum]
MKTHQPPSKNTDLARKTPFPELTFNISCNPICHCPPLTELRLFGDKHRRVTFDLYPMKVQIPGKSDSPHTGQSFRRQRTRPMDQ